MSEFPPLGSLSISFGEVCDRGKVREENQDSIRSASIPLGDLFIVADGIGGYQGGATASRMVVDGFHSQLALRPAGYAPEKALAEASTYTNASIHTAANSGDPSLHRMGSTVVMALLQAGNPAGSNSGTLASFTPTAWIGHVGDSRAYLIRGGVMSKITSDHSAVQALISRNLITEEEARNHPDASVLTRSLGHRPEVEIEIDRVPIQAGDAILLCSDGLWGYVSDADIAAVVTDASLSVQTIADTLLHQALAAGGQDNIGIEFIRIGGDASITVPEIPISGHAATSRFPARNNVPTSEGWQRESLSSGDGNSGRNRRTQQLLAAGLLLFAGVGYIAFAHHSHIWPFHPPTVIKVGPYDGPPSGGDTSGKTRQSNQKNKDGNGKGQAGKGQPAKGSAPDKSGAQAGNQSGNESGNSTGNQPASQPGTRSGNQSGTQPANQQGTPPDATPDGSAPNGSPPSNAPADRNRHGIRRVGVFGEMPKGKHTPPSDGELDYKVITIRRDSNPGCAQFERPKTQVFTHERGLLGIVLKHRPDITLPRSGKDVEAREMTDDVKEACGADYDMIVVLPPSKPSPSTPRAPTDPPTGSGSTDSEEHSKPGPKHPDPSHLD